MPRKVKEQEPATPTMSTAVLNEQNDSIRQSPAPQAKPPVGDTDGRLAALEAENQKLVGMLKEMLARDEARVAAEAKKVSDEAARVAALPPPEWTIEVEAYNQGTYPEPGAMHAWLRNPGDRFRIKNKDHFREEWMRMPGAAIPNLKSDIVGHGPGFTPGVGIPLTGVHNQVKDPLAAINDATRAAMAR
jgi:hypothetical protein